MDQKRALDPDPMGRDPTNREVFIDTAATPPNDNALEGLQALTATLDDLHMCPDRITRAKVRDIAPEILTLEIADRIDHCFPPSPISDNSQPKRFGHRADQAGASCRN